MADSSMTTFMQEKVMPAVNKFTNFHFVRCMQKGIVACTNATMIGSIFMLLLIPPFPAEMSGGIVDAWRNFSAANAGLLNLGYTFAGDHEEIIEEAVGLSEEMELPKRGDTFVRADFYECFENMGLYWTPAQTLGEEIVKGTVTHDNAAEKTEETNKAMNSAAVN